MGKRRANLDETLTACPVCGSKDIPALIYMRQRAYQGYLIYANCQGCGQVFLNPRMSDAQTEKYYQGDYRSRLMGPTGVNEQDQTAQRLRASLQAQVLTLWGVVPFTVLDVGCGSGFLLWEWEKRGANCTGVEPDVRCHLRKPAEHFPMYTDVAGLPEGKFDLICMSHSLEHMNHPKEFLQDLLGRCAKDDTKLMIEVPNGECCIDSYRIHHPMAFTRYTLEALLHSLGWRVTQFLYHSLVTTNTPHRYLLVLAEKEKTNGL